MATDEDDGKIVREIKANASTQFLDQTRYIIKVKTGTERGAGTDADVHIQLFGKKNQTDKILLKNSENSTNKFESGQVDKFFYDLEDIGKVS